MQVHAIELPAAATTYVRVHPERPLTVTLLPLVPGFSRFRDHAIQFFIFTV